MTKCVPLFPKKNKILTFKDQFLKGLKDSNFTKVQMISESVQVRKQAVSEGNQ